MSSDTIRHELEQELNHLIITEQKIDQELAQFFSVISEGKSVSSGFTYAYESTSDLNHALKKVSQFAPSFEIMSQGSLKLMNQIDDCRNLSDRLSIMVRRLDMIQIRAQEALACTEDVINMKDCKTGLISAIEDRNLPLAVSYIKQVHDIDKRAAKASDDYASILEAEKEVCNLVRAEFEAAITNSNIDRVLELCPLLQTVGLEVEARDTFISFMEDNIFISISADAAEIDSTDHATAYAQTLASIFNNACLIFQQYLPIVLQGMEKSDGDMVFIRRLHGKCAQESGLVVKRYMKFRNVKSCIAAATASSSILSRMSNSRNKKTGAAATPSNQPVPTPAEMHQILDEIAIILQYCCSYGQYVSMLCKGAEDRPRNHVASDEASNAIVEQKRVFSGPSDFDQMVDELINSYYAEGEHWLMLRGIECITKAEKKISKSSATGGTSSSNDGGDNSSDDDDDDNDGDFDGCFFVLQRCSQRAIATNNINAACAILHFMADHLSNDLLQYLTQELETAVDGLSSYVGGVMQNILKSNSGGGKSAKVRMSRIAQLSLSKGIQNVFSGGGVGGGVGTSDSEGGDGEQNGAHHLKQVSQEVEAMEIFNSVEQCARYTLSLRREILASSSEVFGTDDDASNDSLAKINMCLENFDESKECFIQAINNAASKLAVNCESFMAEVFSKVLGEINFSLEGDLFDNQEVVQMVPKVLVGPFEILLRLCTESLNDYNKDLLVGMLVNSYTANMESFISKVRRLETIAQYYYYCCYFLGTYFLMCIIEIL